MSDFTPTTEQVRNLFRLYNGPEFNGLRMTLDAWADTTDAAFDRWLAQHDAEILRNAATELAEIERIGDTAVDLLNDEDLARFSNHVLGSTLGEATGREPCPARRIVRDWLNSLADQIEAGAS